MFSERDRVSWTSVVKHQESAILANILSHAAPVQVAAVPTKRVPWGQFAQGALAEGAAHGSADRWALPSATAPCLGWVWHGHSCKGGFAAMCKRWEFGNETHTV